MLQLVVTGKIISFHPNPNPDAKPAAVGILEETRWNGETRVSYFYLLLFDKWHVKRASTLSDKGWNVPVVSEGIEPIPVHLMEYAKGAVCAIPVHRLCDL